MLTKAIPAWNAIFLAKMRWNNGFEYHSAFNRLSQTETENTIKPQITNQVANITWMYFISIAHNCIWVRFFFLKKKEKGDWKLREHSVNTVCNVETFKKSNIVHCLDSLNIWMVVWVFAFLQIDAKYCTIPRAQAILFCGVRIPSHVPRLWF